MGEIDLRNASDEELMMAKDAAWADYERLMQERQEHSKLVENLDEKINNAHDRGHALEAEIERRKQGKIGVEREGQKKSKMRVGAIIKNRENSWGSSYILHHGEIMAIIGGLAFVKIQGCSMGLRPILVTDLMSDKFEIE